MFYLFEQLGDERFQELCGALVAREYPRSQCMPLNQRDGGRDIIVHSVQAGRPSWIAFQVKFVMEPQRISDRHKWLEGILRKEIPKAKRMAERGASEYILMTNVLGTSKPKTGTIDKANEALSSALPIPAMVWWGNDISSRVEAASDLKWSYPEILKVTDLIKYFSDSLEDLKNSERNNIADTLRTFLENQYHDEKDVRFQQISLESGILELFVDVPMHDARWHRREVIDYRPGRTVGKAAKTLLNHRFQREFPFIVLEGAPGQGKSTVLQYVCQKYREALININSTRPLRFPIKVDLRDFAMWVRGKDPYSYPDQASRPSGSSPSLEEFVAHMLSNLSGGRSFSVSDFHQSTRHFNYLIALDGLDEVALDVRKEVVSQVEQAARRILRISKSTMFILTSRPAAMAGVPQVSRDISSYFFLGSLTEEATLLFCDKWSRAMGLDEHRQAKIRRTLRLKLSESHVRELARNPMQLGILLNLLYTKGVSLPEKRTALYSAYVSLFFDREASKSPVVLEHRDLLIELHGHVAWLLHTSAESESKSAGVSVKWLEKEISRYLSVEGHDVKLGEHLKIGSVERVQFIVQKSEGSYEFEVQPLREYFAASHLYATAQSVPASEDVRGSKPERFDAIARNPYWQNVCRFYAGFYTKGELPSLVDGLEEVMRDNDLKWIDLPQTLCVCLLSDWVFNSNIRSLKKVVRMAVSPNSIRALLWSRNHAMPGIPEKCGRDEFYKECMGALDENDLPRDLSLRMATVLHRLSPAGVLRQDLETRIQNLTGSDRTKWARYGNILGGLRTLSDSALKGLIEEKGLDDTEREERIACLLRDGVTSIPPKWMLLGIRSILSSRVEIPELGRPLTVYCRLSLVIQLLAFDIRGHGRRAERRIQSCASDREAPGSPTSELGRKSQRLFELAVSATRKLKRVTSLQAIGKLIDEGHTLFGEIDSRIFIAAAPSLVESSPDKFLDRNADWFDVGLVGKYALARSKTGAPKWWQNTLRRQSKPSIECLVFLFATATTRTLLHTVEEAEGILQGLESDGFERLIWSLLESVSIYEQGSVLSRRHAWSSAKFKTLSDRFVVALAASGRAALGTRKKVTQRLASRKSELEKGEVLLLSRLLLPSILLWHPRMPWKERLAFARKFFGSGGASVPKRNPHHFITWRFGERSERAEENLVMDIASARHVLEYPLEYPLELVDYAHEILQVHVYKTTSSVASIAERGNWFAQQDLQ